MLEGKVLNLPILVLLEFLYVKTSPRKGKHYREQAVTCTIRFQLHAAGKACSWEFPILYAQRLVPTVHPLASLSYRNNGCICNGGSYAYNRVRPR